MAFWNRNRNQGNTPDPAKAVRVDRNVTVFEGAGNKANATKGTAKYKPQARRGRWESLPVDSDGVIIPLKDDLSTGLAKSSWKPGDEDGW